MIRRLWLILAIGALGACTQAPAAPPAPAPQDTAAEEAKMRADLARWFDDYNKGNADAVAAQYAEDGVLMPPAAPPSTGREAIKGFLTADSATTKAAGLMLKNGGVTGIGFSGDFAWMSGTFSVVDAKGATVDTGKYLSVHRKTNGAWLYVRDIWNSNNPPPPPVKK
jgi:ketosteroid isomerase-like protein